MNSAILASVITVPSVMAFTQILKSSGLPGRLCPLAALVLGIVGGALQAGAGVQPWGQAILAGVGLGLAAAGAYDAATTAKASITGPSNAVPIPPPPGPPPMVP